MRLQFRMLELFDAMLYSADFPDGFRAAVGLRGFQTGLGRQPQTNQQKIDHAALQCVLRCILADFGYVDATPLACPPRAGQMDQDRINHITAAAFAELHQPGAI